MANSPNRCRNNPFPANEEVNSAVAKCPHENQRIPFDIESLAVPTEQPLVPISAKIPNWKQSKINVEFTLASEDPAFITDSMELLILAKGNTLHTLTAPQSVRAGRHKMTWDGYSSAGVMDTQELARIDQIKIRVRQGGQTREASMDIRNKPAQVHWAAAKIDLAARTVVLDVYLYFQNGSGLPPAEFNRLQALAIQGIGRYWSRTIHVGGIAYPVTTQAHHRARRDAESNIAAIGVDIKKNSDPQYSRSHNSGIVDATFFYNEGYHVEVAKKRNVSDPQQMGKNAADSNFMHMAAHEFGHSVLMAAVGLNHSWGHKGSTSVLFQSTHSGTAGYPNAGEIDLMQYYDEKKNAIYPDDFYIRSTASAEDVKHLISLTQITFNSMTPQAGD